ncbi:MAG: VOC family protein [Chloroflexi bacterium]|nr:VOC family protein [Chloroflexota bacterium]
MTRDNTEFAVTGINHLALVCRDMERTVDFYSNVLGFPLIKTLDLPMNLGQHFFFDIGNGDSLAFFWFPNAPDGVPGVSAPGAMPMQGDIVTAVGSMNHVAFNVPADKMEEYRDKLRAKGVKTTEVVNHDGSRLQVSKEMHAGVFVRSLYFQDPDGILLEFAAWTKVFTEADVTHKPATAADREGFATRSKASDPVAAASDR